MTERPGADPAREGHDAIRGSEDVAREAGNAPDEGSPYIHLPISVVAIGLVVLLGALLAFGLYANANLRPQTMLPATEVAASTLAPIATSQPAAATPQP